MDTKDILLELRTRSGLSQQDLADKVHVTRQAISRWETGETLPSTDSLQLLSQLFNVSINTLLGSPRQLICQCCGMPLTDEILSREPDGSFNEDYCQWCYANGQYAYPSLESLIDFLSQHMANAERTPGQIRAYLQEVLPHLKHWQA